MAEPAEYGVKIVRIEGALPTFDIDDDNRTITYTYDGDHADLALLCQEAGRQMERRRLVPVLSFTEPVE